MRFSLFVAVVCGATAVLLLSQYTADAALVRTKFDNVRRFGYPRSSMIAAFAGSRRMRRQSGPSEQCIEAATVEFSNQSYIMCSEVLEQFGNLNDITTGAISNFCGSHCPAVMREIFHKLLGVCGRFIKNETLPEYERLLNQSCNRDDQQTHNYCLQDWVNVNSSLSTSDYQIYEECYDGSKSSKDCPDACKQAIPYIQQNLGCCYKAYQMYELSPRGDGIALSDQVYKTCNYQPPALCKQQRSPSGPGPHSRPQS